jgi:hypothetical protein
MNIVLSCILVFTVTVATYAEADPQYPYYMKNTVSFTLLQTLPTLLHTRPCPITMLATLINQASSVPVFLYTTSFKNQPLYTFADVFC